MSEPRQNNSANAELTDDGVVSESVSGGRMSAVQFDGDATPTPSEPHQPGATEGRATADGDRAPPQHNRELPAAIEALIFVSEEPITVKQLANSLGDVPLEAIQTAAEELMAEFNAREGGLEIRHIAGGYRISTRPEFHEQIRRYLRTRPSARLPLASLETLAVIAYKQPITLPEIQDIRGKNSISSVKTLLERRLIVPKGRKPVVGRPMMYGTSREFLVQFGLNDLSELPSIEDFEDLALE